MSQQDCQPLPETYEKNDRNTPLELYEWENIWWEQTGNTDAVRVLYIGDSISCGLRQKATAVSGEKILFDNFSSSKALDNPFLFLSISAVMAQQNKRDAVLVNFGLHGWHMDDDTYTRCYKAFLSKLKEAVNCPIFLVLTTYLSDKSRNDRVIKRNKNVDLIAKEFDLPVIDLYTVSERIKEHQMPDGVHFDNDGYQLLAQSLVEQLKSGLNI